MVTAFLERVRVIRGALRAFLPPPGAFRPVVSHLLVPLVLMTVMSLTYLGAFHKPSPRGLRIDIIGSTPAIHLAADRLGDRLGDLASVHTVATASDARRLLSEQKLEGAYQTTSRSADLLIASAASAATAQAVEAIFAPVAYAQHLPLQVQDAAPLSPDDPTGHDLFFLLVALSIGAYTSAVAIGAAGASLPMRARALAGAAASLVVTGIGVLVAGPILGALPGHVIAVAGLAWLYTAGVVLIGIGLHTFLGRFTTGAMVCLFVALNFTSSGAIYPPALQPGLFATLNSLWNGAAFAEAGTRVLYFPTLSINADLTRLLIWFGAALAGLSVASLAERRRRRHRRHEALLSASVETELEESAVAA